MHDRNIYKIPPDFAKLAEQYEEFSKYVTISSDGRGHINFKDAKALRELTYTLLRHDFGLKMEIPLDRLIPTVPLRLNYILWLEDLISQENEELGTRGVDVGCGASCIYPLLGARLNQWKFIASETDESSFQYAEKNIMANNLADKITLKRGSKDSLLKDVVDSDESITFCMCNPPFFRDKFEALGENSRTESRHQPYSVCTATDAEAVTEGGEVEFVNKMINESLELKEKISWYTTMLGKKISLKILMQTLKEKKVPFVTSTIFQQGKTTRWGLCWSFNKSLKTPQTGMPSPVPPKKNQLPFSFTVAKTEVHSQHTANEVKQDPVKFICKEVERLLKHLQIEFETTSVFNKTVDFNSVFIGNAWSNTWSHQRQKERLEKRRRKSSSETWKSDVVTKGETIEGRENLPDSDEPSCQADLPNALNKEVRAKEGVSDNLKHQSGNSEKEKQGSTPGQKRAFSHTDEAVENCTGKPLFELKIMVSENSNSIDLMSGDVKVDVICLDGNREGVHQLFMFLRNQLNGTQVQNRKKR